MFKVIYFRGFTLSDLSHAIKYGDVSLVGTSCTLDGAKNLRKFSGDVVVDATTNQLVTDPAWLWGWEKAQLSFAGKLICETFSQ